MGNERQIKPASENSLSLLSQAALHWSPAWLQEGMRMLVVTGRCALGASGKEGRRMDRDA